MSNCGSVLIVKNRLYRLLSRSPWPPVGFWLLAIVPVSILAGSASALFLVLLDGVTRLRFAHPWVLFFLPLGGTGILWIYRRWGDRAERGTNLILDEIHEPGGGVPVRIAPMVLLTTLLTHLFGGSAGREGTAVQMGGSLAGGWNEWVGIPSRHRQTVLMCGVAAGFGSVFGTPLAGAVFAVEVLTRGRLLSEALIPCLLAGIVGDLTCSAWGIHHTHYSISPVQVSDLFGVGHLDLLLLGKAALAGGCFGCVAWLFSFTTHEVQRLLGRFVQNPWLRPAVGGTVLIALTYLVGTRAYLGLGVLGEHPTDVTLVSCFHSGGAGHWSWLLKLIFTAITLGSGFKGGEVTPLFFIGAALGSALSAPLGTPTDWLAGLGMMAVFAGASHTPLACTIMGLELFGAEHAVHLAVACTVACFFNRSQGIYRAQRGPAPGATSGMT